MNPERHGHGEPADGYRHLNKDDVVPFDIEATAKIVCDLNYGLHRFLSAVIRIKGDRPELVAGLRKLLSEGYY